jgi:hypothetical protein
MAKYLVKHNYQSVVFGGVKHKYNAGDVVELIPSFADWMNRDSPGVLELWVPEPSKTDRMIKAPGKRR